ncbi:MurR/RpiR family transcriptional regulator [Rhizobium tubonense]|uniref:RpiR family transcriptional regulator n=1 Tax=Rhizobium tubonense TaxID=484088 RepID=A0A2W4EP33_9HYPH|nr:MurR/RpiR family transcriptional regulator [Rhizobium tubonense]PZM12973.1 RpiR family transcriptional regulator [Rhizobium tubonense]
MANVKAKRNDPGALAYLEASIPDLPTATARAAIYIVENADKVVRFSLKDLSKFSKAGEASIVRLCQLAGFSGFSDFKLALAAELAVRQRQPDIHNTGDGDSLSKLGHELARSIVATVELTEQSVLQKIASRLVLVNRIDLFGSGVSGIIAELFSYRLLRAGLNAHAIRDITLAHEVANGLGPTSAAIAISESGVTANTLDFLRVARSAGAFTVAVTCQARSPLAKHADAVLLMAKLNIPAYGGFINSVPRAVYLAEALAALISPQSDIVE